MAFVLALASSLFGCSLLSTGDDAGQVSDLAESFVRDESQWALPLDGYGSFMRNERWTFARDLVMEQCLSERDLPFPEPKIHNDTSELPTLNENGRELMTPDIASRFGYGAEPYDVSETRRMESDWLAFKQATEQGEGAEIADRCWTEADERVPSLPDPTLIEQLATTARDTALAAEAVTEAAGRWRECMAPAGVSDLPDTPQGMPSISMSDQFRELSAQISDYDPDDELPAWRKPSQRELELAVMDAECRESSGYADALYQAEVDGQLDLMEENVEQLERTGAEQEEFDAGLDDLLRDMGQSR